MILAKFVLIIVWWSGNSIVAPFHSADACEAALKEIVYSTKSVRAPLSAKCHWTGL
jgi:hypothetical protein